MNRTDEQQFLVAAHSAAAVHDYFHWRVVGGALKWPEGKSIRTLRFLTAQLLVATQHGEEARLLPAGRQLAQQLADLDRRSQPPGGKWAAEPKSSRPPAPTEIA